MVQNFRIPKPEVNQFIANFGYVCLGFQGLGILMAIIFFSSNSYEGSSMMWIFVFPIGGMILFHLRYVIFARNPSDAQFLPQQELNQFRQQMRGKWTSESDPPNSCNTGTKLVQEIDCVDAQYTYSYFTKNGQRQATRALNIFKTPDGKYWFDNYGAQIYQLDLPNSMVCVNYIGQDWTWRRTSDGAPESAMQSNASGAPPVYSAPTAPPVYDGSMGSNNPGGGDTEWGKDAGKTIAEQIKDLNDLRDQGILSEAEFQSAKAKVLA